jgi:hypothetical protein
MNLLVSDEQRTCTECSDDVPCHTCIHKSKFNSQVETINAFIENTFTHKRTKEYIIGNAIKLVFPEGLKPKKAKTHYELASAFYDTL